MVDFFENIRRLVSFPFLNGIELLFPAFKASRPGKDYKCGEIYD